MRIGSIRVEISCLRIAFEDPRSRFAGLA